MNSLSRLALVFFATAGFANTANAQTATYDVNGLFSNGTILGGSFSFDPAGQPFSQFTNINITLSGIGSVNSIVSGGYSVPATGIGQFQVNFQNENLPTANVHLIFQADHDRFILKSIADQYLSAGSSYSYQGTNFALVYGTIAASGVPEPATWGLMLVGFGAIGGVLRRRQKVAARIRFA